MHRRRAPVSQVLARRQPRLVQVFVAGLFMFQQNKPAPEPVSQRPPTCALIPTPCEAATDAGVAVRRGVVQVPEEQARAGAVAPITADVRPHPKFKRASPGRIPASGPAFCPRPHSPF